MNIIIESNLIYKKSDFNNTFLIYENSKYNNCVNFSLNSNSVNFSIGNGSKFAYYSSNKNIIQLENYHNENEYKDYSLIIEANDNTESYEYKKADKIFSDSVNISSYNSSLSQDKNKDKLNSIRKLEYNWNDNDAEAIDKIICDNILKIIEEVIIQPKIFPTANNSIQLEYYDYKDKNKYLEFEVFKDYINIYEVLSNSKEKSYIINSVNVNKINSIIMDFYELNRR